MSHLRVSLARDAGVLPACDGRIAVLGAFTPDHLELWDAAESVGISQSFQLHSACLAAGYTCHRQLDGGFDHALVCLPRAKNEAYDLIAQAAAAAPRGWVIVDGAKTDGIDSVFKAISKCAPAANRFAKAHGKVIWFRPDAAQGIGAWHVAKSTTSEGFVTAPGVFSADSVDPASAFLAAHLPIGIKGAVGDLGAGWGYLSERFLASNPDVTRAHLVEDNAAALDCARVNVTDSRAVYHWANALEWRAPEPLSCVIMNPPFHTARKADPALGQGFVRAAARALRPGGQLFMVANAHLPYEVELQTQFSQVTMIGRDNRFKLFRAEKPRTTPR